MENSVKKREWVKTAAIIFLAVLLVLTFFSKTIMNASLPEVASQQVATGAINARIRGTGAVEASEVYNVTIKQTRKIASVLVHSGQQIVVGDTLFVLEAEESDEVAAAEEELAQLQQSYDKTLIEAGNASAQDNYDLQKAQSAYNEALAIYNQYSTADPTQLATQKAAAEAKLKDMQTQKTALENQLTKLKAENAYTDAQAVVAEHEATLKTLEKEKATLKETITIADPPMSASYYEDQIDALKRKYVNQLAQYDGDFLSFYNACDKDPAIMKACYENADAMAARIGTSKPVPSGTTEGVQTYASTDTAAAYRAAYENLSDYYLGGGSEPDGLFKLQDMLKLAAVNDKIYTEQTAMHTAQTIVKNYESSFEMLQEKIDLLDLQITDQQAVIDKLSSASSAAESVKSAKKALEDLIFQQGLGDSSSIDIAAAKENIDKKTAELEKLRANADELEVKANVSGTIDTVYAAAGKSIGGEDQPLATISVTDRGFTLKIDVTNEQAKKVKVGDTAELVNFWGGDASATLEQITSSQTSGSRTLVFALAGDIQAGQNITLSIGQKSSNFDAIIPLSALKEDANGKFVYVLESKSSPLGSRYIATRVPVQELARDDKSAAVSGISAGDFVITTSDKPIEAGKQVRLADNG